MAVGNSVNDEIREQRHKLKDGTPKEKLGYFLDYYKVHAIVTVIVIVLGSVFIHDILSQKDSVMSATFLNSFPNVETQEFMLGFSESLGINTDKVETLLDSSMYISDEQSDYVLANTQKLIAMVAAGSIDLLAADQAYFEAYADQGFFNDLSQIMGPEQLAQYEDLLYYYDIPDDEVNEEVPIGINISNFSKIVSTQSYPNTEAYCGIVVSGKNVENALAFIDYLNVE